MWEISYMLLLSSKPDIKNVVSRKLFFFLIRAIQGKPPGLNVLVGNKHLKPPWLYMLTAMVCLWIK